ncbi:cation/H(+) antiporter 4 [Prunus yedoensis var. nudiflora]|uniref:Cation/H(+) antiporter 4 n=1 Tax=Prunus yedoensis var. nudiflora TaxID=2094558 RepID=A0A314ULW9_PRUYE|nr:cation/H(+) antiporter 4 [Prunus yedoensis var. nudiflora]
MYDDICTLAIDKATSLIILPFHRKWSRVNGSIESENQNTRTLNCRVLETAPCSVGILVNRGHVKCTNSSASPNEAYRVALIFLGGSDDREALTFAKRVANDTYISLTVIRLVDASGYEDGNDKWEWVQDNEMLKEIKYNGAGYVSYVEQIVEDGIKTTRKIRSLMDENEYDMFIVGRRYNVSSPQTLGLDQWSEFPELGVIGDMLSSTDSRCKSSVLVIQQQQQR